MSSTNRGSKRIGYDYYVTPKNAIRDFLRNFVQQVTLDNDAIILDPCAGGSATEDMSYPKVLSEFGFKNIKTIDIREDSMAETKNDYLNCIIALPPKMIITNPPFDRSIEIIKKALDDVDDGGYVVMLQRLNFMGGKTYKKVFWDEVGLPQYIFVHRARMGFTGDGKTDSIEYAHYVWKKGFRSEFSNIKII